MGREGRGTGLGRVCAICDLWDEFFFFPFSFFLFLCVVCGVVYVGDAHAATKAEREGGEES